MYKIIWHNRKNKKLIINYLKETNKRKESSLISKRKRFEKRQNTKSIKK